MLLPEAPESGSVQAVPASMAMQEKRWSKDALEGCSVPGDDTFTSTRFWFLFPLARIEATMKSLSLHSR